MDGRPTLTDCDEAGDYIVPNVLSPRDLVIRRKHFYLPKALRNHMQWGFCMHCGLLFYVCWINMWQEKVYDPKT